MLTPRFMLGILSAGLFVLGTGMTSGQNYPNKPVRIITNAAGGGADFITRQIAQEISDPLGQPVVVDNRGGVINAMVHMASVLPDGYSLLITGGAIWATPLLQKVPWKIEDFTPVAPISRDSLVVVVHPSLPANSIKELIALAKAKPGTLNWASGSIGGTQHLAMELFKTMAGINIVRVGYNGTPAVITAVLGNEVPMTISDPILVMSNVKSGKLRALAVTSATPSALVPGLPTVAASGLPGYEWIGLTGMFAPAKTPAAIISKLSQEVVRAANKADVKERFLRAGTEAFTSSPEQFAAIVKSEIAKTSQVIKDAGIKID